VSKRNKENSLKILALDVSRFVNFERPKIVFNREDLVKLRS
jgi:hypothetical protein